MAHPPDSSWPYPPADNLFGFAHTNHEVREFDESIRTSQRAEQFTAAHNEVEADVLNRKLLRIRNRPRILVVDNVADAADSQAALLRLWGYHVQVCYGGIAALETARTYRPHVVLLDIGMPGMDGFQVALGLREMMPGLEKTQIIGISGYAGEVYRTRACEAGFDHYLIKPEDPVHLKELLTRVVPLMATRDTERIAAPRPASPSLLQGCGTRRLHRQDLRGPDTATGFLKPLLLDNGLSRAVAAGDRYASKPDEPVVV